MLAQHTRAIERFGTVYAALDCRGKTCGSGFGAIRTAVRLEAPRDSPVLGGHSGPPPRVPAGSSAIEYDPGSPAAARVGAPWPDLRSAIVTAHSETSDN